MNWLRAMCSSPAPPHWPRPETLSLRCKTGMKPLFALLTILILLAGLTGCGGDAAAGSDDGRLHAVTTIGQIGDAAAVIGGEHVRVTSLMGAGTDPHLYKAGARDVDKLRSADIVFYNGLFLEA